MKSIFKAAFIMAGWKRLNPIFIDIRKHLCEPCTQMVLKSKLEKWNKNNGHSYKVKWQWWPLPQAVKLSLYFKLIDILGAVNLLRQCTLGKGGTTKCGIS